MVEYSRADAHGKYLFTQANMRRAFKSGLVSPSVSRAASCLMRGEKRI